MASQQMTKNLSMNRILILANKADEKHLLFQIERWDSSWRVIFAHHIITGSSLDEILEYISEMLQQGQW